MIERELIHDADQASAYLNLKTGKHVKPASWNLQAIRNEFPKAGVDLFHSPFQNNGDQCLCRDMDVVEVKDGWKLTADQVEKSLDDARKQGKSNRNAAPIGTFLNPNVTYVFETRDGSRGVLELVPDKKKPAAKTVRYKLVTQAGGKEQEATNVQSRADDKDKKLIGAWSGGQKVMQRLVLRADGSFDLSYPKGPRIVDVIPASGVWSRDGKTLTLEITKSADNDRVGKKLAREVVELTDRYVILRGEDGICTHFTQARVFHGWTLLR